MQEYAGILLVYLIAVKEEETGSLSVKGIDSLQCPPQNFQQRIALAERDAECMEKEDVMEIYCVLGDRAQTEKILKRIREIHTYLFEKIVRERAFDYCAYIEKNLGSQREHYVLPDFFAWLAAEHIFCRGQIYMPQEFVCSSGRVALAAGCIGMGLEYEDSRIRWMEEAVRIWLEREEPQMQGKQVVTNSFLLSDLRGRRIIGVLPDVEDNGFFLLVEGGRKVRLERGNTAYTGEQIGHRDIGMFSINDISSVLQNPIYAYGILYYPYELFEEWQKVFQYALAVLPVSWTAKNLQTVYESFLDFMESQICSSVKVSTESVLISKRKFFESYRSIIEKMKQYLQGEEEAVISKDWLLLMRSRYTYLDKIQRLLMYHYPREQRQLQQTQPFVREEFLQLLKLGEERDANRKGVAWENVAEYLLARIPGLKVEGKRKRVARQEIDLCCSNVSTDEELWKLGALLLVECKNWEQKADVSVIRNMGQMMRVKGTTAALLFSKNGITRDARQEIWEQARLGGYILCIAKADLLSVRTTPDCYKLLQQKIREVEGLVADDLGVLG